MLVLSRSDLRKLNRNFIKCVWHVCLPRIPWAYKTTCWLWSFSSPHQVHKLISIDTIFINLPWDDSKETNDESETATFSGSRFDRLWTTACAKVAEAHQEIYGEDSKEDHWCKKKVDAIEQKCLNNSISISKWILMDPPLLVHFWALNHKNRKDC